jgi:hypothetical protein
LSIICNTICLSPDVSDDVTTDSPDVSDDVTTNSPDVSDDVTTKKFIILVSNLKEISPSNFS